MMTKIVGKVLALSLLIWIAPVSVSSPATPQITPAIPPKVAKKLVSFNFENEDLTTIINYLADELKVNVMLPMPPNNITAKVTLRHQKKISLHNAFALLQTILDVAGYNILPHGKNMYTVRVTDQNVNREGLPTYIGVAPEELPSNDIRIRYVYFFDNIKIPAGGGGQAQEIRTMLEDMLKDPARPGTGDIIFDSTTNSMILTANAYSIKIAMQVIGELDKTGFRELVEVVPLVNTSADFVARFLNEQLLAPIPNTPATGIFPNTDHSYFSKTIKLVADPRSNSLILLGRAKALERLKNFINKYIDIPLESGDSIVHVYDLQYLEASTFADDLANIIKTQEVPGQAKGTAESRQFQGVIIAAEKFAEAQKIETKAGEAGAVAQGGNRLIIAAKKTDWIALKHLIDDLDKPQPQVSLDVLVVDVSLSDVAALNSQLRNPDSAIARNVNAQFDGSDQGQVLSTPPVNLNSDLLQIIPAIAPAPTPANLAVNQGPGNFILSFFDKSTNGNWWVMNILQAYTNSRIITHPHITTVNQRQATVSIAQTKLTTGPVKQNPDGSTVQTTVNIAADITVELLPRINLSNSINLQIAVKVNNFATVQTVNQVRTMRTFITNATVGNGEVLVLGGLIQDGDAAEGQDVPILSSLPLVGWMFKGKTKTVTREDLMVFIAPTVIKPRLGGGVSAFTADKFASGDHLMAEGDSFDSLRDPINRWYFASPKHSAKGLASEYKADAFFSDKPLQDAYEPRRIIPEVVHKGKKHHGAEDAPIGFPAKKTAKSQKTSTAIGEQPRAAMPSEEHAAMRLKDLLNREPALADRLAASNLP